MSVALLLGLVATLAVIAYLRLRPKPCTHVWEPRGVSHYRHWRNHYDALGKKDGEIEQGDSTTVLSVCARCGEQRTESIPGEWTISQLTKRPSASEMVDDLLKQAPKKQ